MGEGAFDSDPGPAPSVEPDIEGEQVSADDPRIIDTSSALSELGVDLRVTPEQAGYVLRAVWGMAHLGVRFSGGPDDAFEPTDGEIAAQARPTAAVLSRFEPLARLAQYSDFGAMAVLLAGYASGELGRVAAYRSAESGEWEPSPVADEPVDTLPDGRPLWRPRPPAPVPSGGGST